MGGVRDVQNDRELLETSRAGEGGFGVFYRRHCAAVLAFHARRTLDPELAADLTAETFAAALLVVRDRSRPLPKSPAGWLFTIAHHEFVDSYRRGRIDARARRQLAFERMEISDAAADQLLETVAATDVLDHLARHLPADQFEALRARVIDDREYGEIARELDCSESLVRLRVSRALKTLRTRTRQELLEADNG